MKLLLDDKFAPITSSIGFISCPTRDVVEAYVHWMSPIQAGRINYLTGQAAPVSLTVTHGNGSLPEMLETLLPLTSVEARRMLFIQSTANWTAFFANGSKGTDVPSTVSTLCRMLNCQGVRSTCIPHTLSKQEGHNKGRYGATMFELYGTIERAIGAAHDGKWTFYTCGVPQSFEEPDAYVAKRKKDRFTPELLDRYLRALGVHAFDSDFYVSSGGFFLVEKVGPFAPGVETFSLDQARATFE